MQAFKPGRTGFLAIIAVACFILAPATIGAQEPIALTAVRVDALPSIDGATSDTCWDQATAAEIGPFVVKAVYSDTELCLLCTYQAPALESSAVTSDAVASGRAIAGGTGLSDRALAEIWSAYEYLQASLPGLVPATSSGVRVGAASADGTWTVELTRPMETGGARDLQFSDLNEAYVFSAAGTQASLAFAGDGPGLAAGYEEEEKTGCFCRTTM